MKKCPNCNYDIPKESHFCPRCLYREPKQEILNAIPFRRKPSYKVYFLIIAVLLIVIFYLIGILSRDGEEKNNGTSQEQKTEIPYNEAVQFDYRDCLTSFESVKDYFGEETDTVYIDYQENAIVRTFGNTLVYMNGDKNVMRIDIRYGTESFARRCGIYAIDSTCTKQDVISLLGPADKTRGKEEWIYQENMDDLTTLTVLFGGDGRVGELNYYKVYSDETETDIEVIYHEITKVKYIEPSDIPYNDWIAIDMRDYMAQYEEVSDDFGILTDDMPGTNGYRTYEHGNITVDVTEEGNIAQIYVYYQKGRNPSGAGAYGINETSTKEEILTTFGEPNEEVSPIEWYYYLQTPDLQTLCIIFDGDYVESTTLYRVLVD